MFGFFKSKLEARDVGEIIAENSIIYTEPVLLGLKKLGNLEDRLTEKQMLEFGYSLMLNSGSVLIPLLLHYLRTISFDREGFKEGANAYFDRFRDVYCDKLNLSFGYDFSPCINASEAEIKTNANFLRTNTFYGNGAQDSVYANLVRFIAAQSTPTVFPNLFATENFNAQQWSHMLECIEGLDRSFKWITQCFDFKQMKRV